MSSRVGGAGPGPSDSRTSRPNNYIHPLSSELLPSNKYVHITFMNNFRYDIKATLLTTFL